MSDLESFMTAWAFVAGVILCTLAIVATVATVILIASSWPAWAIWLLVGGSTITPFAYLAVARALKRR